MIATCRAKHPVDEVTGINSDCDSCALCSIDKCYTLYKICPPCAQALERERVYASATLPDHPWRWCLGPHHDKSNDETKICSRCDGLQYELPENWIESPWILLWLAQHPNDNVLEPIYGPANPSAPAKYRIVPPNHPKYRDAVDGAIRALDFHKVAHEEEGDAFFLGSGKERMRCYIRVAILFELPPKKIDLVTKEVVEIEREPAP